MQFIKLENKMNRRFDLVRSIIVYNLFVISILSTFHYSISNHENYVQKTLLLLLHFHFSIISGLSIQHTASSVSISNSCQETVIKFIMSIKWSLMLTFWRVFPFLFKRIDLDTTVIKSYLQRSSDFRNPLLRWIKAESDNFWLQHSTNNFGSS